MNITRRNRIEIVLKLCNFPDSTIIYTCVICNRIPFISVYFCSAIVGEWSEGSCFSVVWLSFIPKPTYYALGCVTDFPNEVI